MKIAISRKRIRQVVILTVCLFALVYAFVMVGPGLFWPKAGIGSGEGTPEVVAVAFTENFYTVDYRNKGEWLERLKPLSSQDGYRLITDLMIPTLWPQLTKAQVVASEESVTATDKGLILEGTSMAGGVPWQIRKVSVAFKAGSRWPQIKADSFETNLLLSQEEGGWKFNVFMDDKQVEAFEMAQEEVSASEASRKP